jgi:putative transcriptional regulator
MGKADSELTGAIGAILETASALHRVGAIDRTTMREFEALSLAPPLELTAGQIKEIREAARVSQPVFARYLGTSESTVEKWESGAKSPSGMARRLLSVVARHGIGFLA